MSDPENVLLNTYQLAERWGCSYSALAMDRMHKRGCKYIKFSERKIRYRLSDVLEYEKANMVEPAE